MGSNDVGMSVPYQPAMGSASPRLRVNRSDRRYVSPPPANSLTYLRGQVLDGHRQMIGGRPRLPGVVYAVRAHGGNERPGHPDGVDAPPDPVRAVDVGRVMPGRRLPAGAGDRGDVVQAARPEHVARPPVGPVPAVSPLVVVPLALVDEVGEPFDVRVRVGGLVQVPGLAVQDPV